MLLEISKNLGKRSVTHILLTEEQTTKKSIYIYITLIKTKIRKNISSRKIHLQPIQEIKPTRNVKKDKSTRKFLSLKYINEIFILREKSRALRSSCKLNLDMPIINQVRFGDKSLIWGMSKLIGGIS